MALAEPVPTSVLAAAEPAAALAAAAKPAVHAVALAATFISTSILKTHLRSHDCTNALPYIEFVSNRNALPERVSCSVPPVACCAPALDLPSHVFPL